VVTLPSDSELPDAPPSAAIEPAPEPDPQSAPEAPTAPPMPVVVSFWILIASAALRMLVVVITVVNWTNVVNELLKQPRPANTSIAQATSAIHSYLIANLVLDFVFAGLYVLFAFLMRRGRNWARLTITAIVALFAVLGVLNGSDLFTLVSVLIELVAVGLLYMRSSKDYFTAMRAHYRLRR